VRRADAGEKIIDMTEFSETSETNEDDSSEERIETLAEIICRAGVSYGDVVSVINEVRKLGVDKIGLVADKKKLI
jgi:biopolymer transport protein ExbD